MKNELLPANLMHQCLPVIVSEFSRTGQSVLILLISLCVLSLGSLPFIRLRISVSGQGILRPETEIATVSSLIPGIVDEVFFHEGEYVSEGSAILRLNSYEIEEQLHFNTRLLNETSWYLLDLQELLGGEPKNFSTDKYKKEYAEYIHHLLGLDLQRQKAEKELERHRKLFQLELISEKEYDDLNFHLVTINKEMDKMKNEKLNIWQSLQTDYLQKQYEIKSIIRQLEDRKAKCTILSPVSGSLEKFSGVYPGSIVSAGRIIAEISPETGLIGEIYVNSRAIGNIREHQTVNLQVDAFPYQRWGTVKAEISHISKDYILDKNGNVAFKVRCHLYHPELRQKNGRKGILKKGMTLRARFLMEPQSILQLILQKAGDCLNPDETN